MHLMNIKATIRLIHFITPLIVVLFSCSDSTQYDLVIKNANVLNVVTGELQLRNILIKGNKILQLSDQNNFKSLKEIDAHGRLVTPGLIDTHIHPTDVFGDYAAAPLFIPEDSAAYYRQNISDAYLPYGITTALMMGQPENWLKNILEWNEGHTLYTDFLTCGSAFISKEKRTPYIGHVTVDGIHQAKAKVIAYYNQGISHVKLYYRLREPEFSAVFKTADSLGMKIYGHIGDFDPARLSIRQTLEKGLKNYEHIATFPYSIIRTEDEWKRFDTHFESLFGEANTIEKVLMMFLEAFRYIDENKRSEADDLIRQLAVEKATFSTTVAFMHQQFTASHYFPYQQNSLSDAQIKRSEENFGIMMRYLKKMADEGVVIRIATDGPSGGKLFLTELSILSAYDFSIPDIFKIATLNGAIALGLEKEIGSLEKGMQANLVIWEKSPFDHPDHFFSEKVIIKSGALVN